MEVNMKKVSIKFSIFSLVLVIFATGSAAAMNKKYQLLGPITPKTMQKKTLSPTNKPNSPENPRCLSSILIHDMPAPTQNTSDWDENGHRIKKAPKLNEILPLDQQIVSFFLKENRIPLAQSEKSESLTQKGTLPIPEKPQLIQFQSESESSDASPKEIVLTITKNPQDLYSESERSEEQVVTLFAKKKEIEDLESLEKDSFIDDIDNQLESSRQRKRELSQNAQRTHEERANIKQQINQIKSTEMTDNEIKEVSEIIEKITDNEQCSPSNIINSEKKTRISLLKTSIVMVGLVIVGIIVWLLVRKGSRSGLVKAEINPRCLSLDNQVKTCVSSAVSAKKLIQCQTTVIQLAHDCKFSKLAQQNALSLIDYSAAARAQTNREVKSFLVDEESKQLYNELTLCVKETPTKIHAFECTGKFLLHYANPKNVPNFEKNFWPATKQAIYALLSQIWHK